MSVSARSTKAAMYSEIERLRSELDKSRCSTFQNMEKQPQSLSYQDLAPRRSNLVRFCKSYCQTMGTRSVPGHIVYAWLSRHED